MARGSAIRWSRIAARPAGESEPGVAVERAAVTFWCADGYSAPSTFAAVADRPLTWDCHSCGRPAGLDRNNLLPLAWRAPFKSHPAYFRDRRSDADAEKIPSEAQAQLRAAC